MDAAERDLRASLEAELGQGTAAAGEDDAAARLRLYGFADVSYSHPVMSASNPWSAYNPPNSFFTIGHVNTYLDAQLSARVRSLIEVRLLFAPNGSFERVLPDGIHVQTSTEVPDTAEFPNTFRWGGASPWSGPGSSTRSRRCSPCAPGSS